MSLAFSASMQNSCPLRLIITANLIYFYSLFSDESYGMIIMVAARC